MVMRRRFVPLLLALLAGVVVSGGAAAGEGAVLDPAVLTPMLFAEWDLKDITAFAEGSDQTDRPPWTQFRRALAARERGERKTAIAELRRISRRAESGTGVRLWAWANLRRLGVTPPAGNSDQVQGVVFEIPADRGVDLLAAYADGRWRYVDHRGGGVFWEDTTRSESRAITDAILSAAQRAVFWVPERSERERSAPRGLRITLLTFAGLRQTTPEPSLFEAGGPFGPLADGQRRLRAFLAQLTARGPGERPAGSGGVSGGGGR